MNDQAAFQFKGFDDWVDIFAGGDQVDSAGRKHHFTDDDLDELIATHSKEHPAPLVLGHPENNDPAFGWTGGGLRRKGKILQAKFTQVVDEFKKAVEDGRYRNRSISIGKNADGKMFIRHVGWLGAARPAVEGLKPLKFSDGDDPVTTFEFAEADTRTPNLLGRALRQVREFLIDKHSINLADKVLPSYMVDEAESIRRANDAQNRRDREREREAEAAETDPDYSESNDEDITLDTKDKGGDAKFSQADLDAAVSAEREKHETAAKEARAKAEFSERLVSEKEFVGQLVADNKILPAQAAGLPEFLAHLPDGDDAQFEFAEGSGDKKKTRKIMPAEYIRAYFSGLPAKYAELMQSHGDDEPGEGAGDAAADFRAPAGYHVQPEALELHRKAVAFQAANDGVTYIDAIKRVSQ